jgi:hypothetical protein
MGYVWSARLCSPDLNPKHTRPQDRVKTIGARNYHVSPKRKKMRCLQRGKTDCRLIIPPKSTHRYIRLLHPLYSSAIAKAYRGQRLHQSLHWGCDSLPRLAQALARLPNSITVQETQHVWLLHRCRRWSQWLVYSNSAAAHIQLAAHRREGTPYIW